VLDLWREELASEDRPQVMLAWSHPLALEPWRLEPGQDLEVVIGFYRRDPVAQTTFKVEKVEQLHKFPQIKVISQ